MKKVSIKLQPNVFSHTFNIFTDPETLYVWIKRPHTHFSDAEPPPRAEFELRQGEFIEVEWRGCEFVYEDEGKFLKLNKVRLARASESQNASGLLASISYGWVTDDIVPMNDCETVDLIVKRISDGEAQLDMPAMFNDNGSDSNDGIVDDDKPKDR